MRSVSTSPGTTSACFLHFLTLLYAARRKSVATQRIVMGFTGHRRHARSFLALEDSTRPEPRAARRMRGVSRVLLPDCSRHVHALAALCRAHGAEFRGTEHSAS